MVGTGGQCVCLREQLINDLDYGGKLIKTSCELLAKLFESCGAYKQSECIHSRMTCLGFYDVPKEIIMRQNRGNGKGSESGTRGVVPWIQCNYAANCTINAAEEAVRMEMKIGI